MIKEGKEVETSCAFCEKKYKFSVEDLIRIRDTLKD
jgi:redox-regulated HSP33 family molecular chaperone